MTFLPVYRYLAFRMTLHRCQKLSLLVVCLLGAFSTLTALPKERHQKQQKQQKLRDEESKDYFKKWLEEDVVYLITPEEKSVFQGLANALEKERFIEQFWFRRDEDPNTPQNEFKTEHYRRIAFANERYAAGYAGWMTDRGRIYVTFGAPDQVTRHSAGETYDRPLYEGGGSTTTYPFEVWRYRHIEGVGSDIELEFVDSTLSGEFRLAIYGDEKDALKHVGISGLTLMEQLGLADKVDRGTSKQQLGFKRARDSLFNRYETYAQVLSPPPIEYKDLKEVVEVNAQFVDLPYTTRQDYIHLNENQILLLVTVQVENKELEFHADEETYAAHLAVYGIVSDLTRHVVFEFDDDLEARFPAASFEVARGQNSVYQKMFSVDRTKRYKMSLVVKDLNSSKIGTQQRLITPVAYQPETLAASSLILADSIETLPEPPATDEMFVIGDVKVRPSLGGEFSSNRPLGVYCQIYNARIDPSTGDPSLSITYRVLRESAVLTQAVDEIGESIQYSSETRVVLVQQLSVRKLEPGEYRFQIIARDRISGKEIKIEEPFKVVPPG